MDFFSKSTISPNSFISSSYHGYHYGLNLCYGPLSTPAYFDYMHLLFWFYFITTFLLSVWLLYTFIFISYYNEKRKPVLETRGFSRAQTGDSLTAVIPLTWSLTMLMHANANSSNFDENTDSTAFTISVIAYQWGWNYFLPVDIFYTQSGYNLKDFLLNVNKCSIIEEKKVDIIKYINLNNIEISYIKADCLFQYKNKVQYEIDYSTDSGNLKIFSQQKQFKLKNLKLYNCLIKTPATGIDLDNTWLSQKYTPELSSSRDSLSGQLKPFENFGGLSHRLNITSGLVLPTNLPIHIICGSKDVIHSWAIPGLFLKIDCIPGYNCHRRIFLKWSGLFWGQCMEVCGRYHHWMPILIKVTHVDLFIIWLKSFF